jgi:hypothetical protein
VTVQALGGSSTSHGPYKIQNGCTAQAISYSAAAGFSNTGTTTNIGGSGVGVYTFAPPTTNFTYCQTPVDNTAVEVDGTTPSTKMTCTSQPCTSFNMISTTGNPETVSFKVKSTYTGYNVNHL